ncbi:7912be00-275d-404e-8c3a-a7ac945b45cc [Thermothielavioides terrestris]|uniref:7912be00-275d-404e-8c3a-a7ac945b45cc n=1 Tax=Thermothielavioides terrestris TaxID=2587410 RepID=A0A3S4D1V8_9PEZI|nr:7912be00-275d-404e-8c3a-a7ac945b45cc [Thermothielavioides terrestris]
MVYGWPAKGGMYIELEFMGLDRFRPVPHPSPDNPTAAPDEEEHCNKMRKLGARWWKTEDEYFDKGAIDYPPVPGIPGRFFRVGWPAGGGVWVLNMSERDAVEKQAGVLFSAYNMEERCRVIEQLGGTFYADPEDCPELNWDGQAVDFHIDGSKSSC